jgi:alpha-tubulin suppressor-like RCC1 family protein
MHIHETKGRTLIRALLSTFIMLSLLSCSPIHTTGLHPPPLQGPLTKYAAVTVGFDHACGLTTASTAFCWGNNNLGQVGAGSFSAVVTRPTAVAGGHTFSMLSAGSTFTCGIGSGGDVFCWGDNTYGQLGSGSQGVAQNIPTPVNFGGMFGPFRSVTAGSKGSACAIAVNGFAYCWGLNYQGVLGRGGGAAVPVNNTGDPFHPGGFNPLPRPLLTSAIYQQISIGSGVACGMTTTGAVDCWGDNLMHQLGNAPTPDICTIANSGVTFPCALAPSRVTLPGTAQMVSVSPGNYVCALLTGTLQPFCWGDFTSDVLGADQSGVPIVPPACQYANGIGGFCSATPILAGIENAAQISMGFDFACAATGPVGAPIVCWGAQDNGQLGDDVVAHALRAVPAPTSVRLTGNVQVGGGAGGGFACVATGIGVPFGVPAVFSPCRRTRSSAGA